MEKTLTVKLKYEGRWEGMPGDSRQWRILSTFIDRNGYDRKGGSFCHQSLIELGIIPSVKGA